MWMFKTFILILGLLISQSAIAQTNTRNPCIYPTVTSTNCIPVTPTTPLPIKSIGATSYSTGITSYTGYTTPTDFFSISGSATKTIKITNIRLSGYATGNDNFPVGLFKRSTANTGGTPTTVTGTPFDSTSVAATAVIATYGVAPTLGALVGPLCACQLQVPAKNGTGGGVLEWQFNRNGMQPVILRGANEMAVLNLYGTTLPAGTNLNITVEWIEE